MSFTSNTQKLIDQFYAIAPYEKLEYLRDLIQNIDHPLDERKNNYEENTKLIDTLKDIFVSIIKERNKMANDEGFDNYFDFVTDWYGLSKLQIDNWNECYVHISKKIVDRIPEYNGHPDDYWSKFNNPVAYFLYEDNNTYKIPSSIYNFFLKEDTQFRDIQSRIKLIEETNRYFYTDFNNKDKTVEIKGNISSVESASAITFAQEVGHAMAYIKLMDENIDPDTKSSYWHEQEAIKKELEYENSLPEKVINVNRDRILYHYVLTSFEKSIYTSSIDPDIAYAKAHNEIYGAKQDKNPFYVLNYFLVDMPCYSAVYSIVYTELLKNYYLE